MDDLISRKAAIESIRECAEAAQSNHEWDMVQGYLNAIECIEEEPFAQPEIIRCKDCKYYLCHERWHGCWHIGGMATANIDGFCSYAERREGEPMSDLIDRQSVAVDMLQYLAYNDWNQGVSKSWVDAFRKCAGIIRDLPSAQKGKSDDE